MAMATTRTAVVVAVVHAAALVASPASSLVVPSVSRPATPWRRARLPPRSRLFFTDPAEPAGDDGSSSSDDDDDASLLASVDPSVLRNLCEQYSLSPRGTKEEMLARLRAYANERAEEDEARRRGRRERVEGNVEGKARHEILDADGFDGEGEAPRCCDALGLLPGKFSRLDGRAMPLNDLLRIIGREIAREEEDEEEAAGYFYYAAVETEDEKKRRLEEEKKKRKEAQRRRSRSSDVTAPLPPDDVTPNEKGERVVTLYSTAEDNDLTSAATSRSPLPDATIDDARYRQKLPRDDRPEESLIGGPFGDASGSRRKKDRDEVAERAKEEVSELVRELLATTGARAFRDDYDEEDDDDGASSAYESPYGFVGFDPSRVPPGLLSASSSALRAADGRVLKGVLSEYELQAIGHDGMAADDVSKGGGHYREVVKVASFLEGYRKAEERRVARETATMLLDRLVREGIRGLDDLLAGMVREGEDVEYANAEAGVGELNSALVRYLDGAIRDQEKRVERRTPEEKGGFDNSREEAKSEPMWNVTRGEDGTILETIDPNDPAVGRMLREELEKTANGASSPGGIDPSTATVQEKMLLLLTLLRDRVRVEAAMGNDSRKSRNLRVLAYCLRAGDDDVTRRRLISDGLRDSLDALDEFAGLVDASIDYAEARSNDVDVAPGRGGGSMLDLKQLRKIRAVVERIKADRSWKASGASP
ncbi:hypothetical protein ACHAWF_013291 [Thalassiosira exigua]